jgi:hypothetical protein
MLYSVGLIYKDSRRSAARYHCSHGRFRWMFGSERARRMGIIQGPTLHGRSKGEIVWKQDWGTSVCGSKVHWLSNSHCARRLHTNHCARSLHTKQSLFSQFTHQTITVLAVYTPNNHCARSLHTKQSLCSQFTHKTITVLAVYTLTNHCARTLHTKHSLCAQFTH